MAESSEEIINRLLEGLGRITSSLNAREEAESEATTRLRDVDAELAKYGKILHSTGDIQDKNNKINEDGIATQREVNDLLNKEARARGKSLEIYKLEERRNAIYQDQIKALNNQLEAQVQLTQAQYADIRIAKDKVKAQAEEIDKVQNAGKHLSTMVGNVRDANGAIGMWKTKLLESAEGNASATGKIIGSFALLELGTTAVSSGFNYVVDQLKASYEGLMQYNAALVTSADGYKLANTRQMVEMKAQAKSLGESSSSFLTLGKTGAGAAAAMLGVALLGGPVSLVALAFTGLAALLGFGIAAKLKQEELIQEKINQDLELSNQLNDKIYDGFMDLGKAGMSGARGITGMVENMHKAGFAIKDQEKFTRVANENQKSLALVAGGTAAGLDKFSTVTGLMTRDLGSQFRDMGISVEEQADATAKYMIMQAKYGLSQGKTTEELAKGAGKYLEELDKLATLTGTTRKEQEDARAAIMGIQQLRAAMMVAEAKGDKAESERLQRYAETAKELQARGMTKEAAGLAKIGATKGAATDEETVIARQMLSSTIEKLDKNLGTQATRTADMFDEANKAYVRSAETFAATGADTGFTGGAYGQAAEAKKIIDEQRKAAKEAGKSLEQFVVDQRKAEDDKTKAANILREKQQATAIAEDNRLLSFADKYSKATSIFRDAVDKFAENFITGKPREVQPPPQIPSAIAPGTPLAEREQARAQGVKNLPSVATEIQPPPQMPRGIRAGSPLAERELAKQELEKKRVNVSGATAPAAAPAAAPVATKPVVTKTYAEILEEQNKNFPVTSAQTRIANEKIARARFKDQGSQPAAPATQTAPAAPVAPAAKAVATKTYAEILEEQNKQFPSTSSHSKLANERAARARFNAQGLDGTTTKSMGKPVAETSTKLTELFDLGAVNFDELDAGFKNSLVAAVGEYHEKTNKKLRLTSAFRTPAQQEELYNRWKKAGGGPDKPTAAGITTPALPVSMGGQLNAHGAGNAIDAGTQAEDMARIVDLSKYNLRWGGTFRTPDPVHIQSTGFQARNGGLFNGPSSGYQVELHGREAVVPLANPSDKISVGKNVEKDPLSSVASNTNNISNSQSTPDNSVLQELFEMMEEKFDDMIDKLDQGNTYADKLVKSMA